MLRVFCEKCIEIICKWRGDFFLLQAAKDDLEDIWLYTLQTWGKEQADHYVKTIIGRLSWLAAHPQLGKPRPDIKPGYLCFPEGRHLIFYRRCNNSIEVLGILHQRLDYLSYLERDQ